MDTYISRLTTTTTFIISFYSFVFNYKSDKRNSFLESWPCSTKPASLNVHMSRTVSQISFDISRFIFFIFFFFKKMSLSFVASFESWRQKVTTVGLCELPARKLAFSIRRGPGKTSRQLQPSLWGPVCLFADIYTAVCSQLSHSLWWMDAFVSSFLFHLSLR